MLREGAVDITVSRDISNFPASDGKLSVLLSTGSGNNMSHQFESDSQFRPLLPPYSPVFGQETSMFDDLNASETPPKDETPIVDWRTTNDYWLSGISDAEQLQYFNHDASEMPEAVPPTTEQGQGPQSPIIHNHSGIDLHTLALDSHLTGKGFTSLPKWVDGSYRPPAPCSHCRRHRLQCLILRTTSANPNPITSCSSCVALFRECSLARGEKRQPSGFETMSPVLGHLHGVTEHPEDGVSGYILHVFRRANRSRMANLEAA